jgi:hypothetical protein
MQNREQKYIIKESELVYLLNQLITEELSEAGVDEEWTWAHPFGAGMGKENRLTAFKYAREYEALEAQVQRIYNEVLRRIEVLQNASGGQTGNNGINENVAGTGFRVGSKLFTKAGAKALQKTTGKALSVAGLASIPAFIAGPDRIGNWINQFRAGNGNITPEMVISAYNELTNWLQNICVAVKEHPEILVQTKQHKN